MGCFRKRGKAYPSMTTTIPAVREDDLYKYLGIEQTLVSDPKAAKERLRAEYLSRLKRVWSSEMNAKNKVNATNI
jgi:hypothetical protein